MPEVRSRETEQRDRRKSINYERKLKVFAKITFLSQAQVFVPAKYTHQNPKGHDTAEFIMGWGVGSPFLKGDPHLEENKVGESS